MNKKANLDMPIPEMKLSARARNVLIRAGCETLGDVVAMGFRNCRVLRCCGDLTVEEIHRCILALGHDWKDYIPKAEPTKFIVTLDDNGQVDTIECTNCHGNLYRILNKPEQLSEFCYCPFCGRHFHKEKE